MKTITTSLVTIMTPNPVTIDPGASLDDALATLERYGFRHLPVVSCNSLVGILSDRDLRLATSMMPAQRRLQDGEGRAVPGPRIVSEIMTRDVHCLSYKEEPARAARDMVKNRIGAIPIMEREELCGIVTETNLLQAFLELCRINSGACDDLVRYHMKRPLTSVSPELGIEDALGRMDGRIAHLGVMRDAELVGIVSERDLFLGLSRERIEDARAQESGRLKDTSLKVADVMSTEVLTVSPGDSVAGAARQMIGFHVGAFPVLEDGEPVGILTQRDILEYYASLVER